MRAWRAADVAELLDQPTRSASASSTDRQHHDPAAHRLERLVRLPAWRRYAACRGRAELFYSGDPISQAIAIAVCAGCGVRDACLAEALADEAVVKYRYGVRGGHTAEQRRRLAKRAG